VVRGEIPAATAVEVFVMNHHVLVRTFMNEESLKEESARTFKAWANDHFCEVTVKLREEGIEVGVFIRPKNREGRPSQWDASWYRYNAKDFWSYIDEHCPEPKWVREAVENLEMPPELKGLFGVPSPESPVS
jgi:hypothetical protein